MKNRFVGAIKKGVAGVQQAYIQQQKKADIRAKQRLATAKTNLEKERVKAELEREQLQLQRELYEAKALVRQEKALVAQARRKAGIISWGERAEGFARSASIAGEKLFKAASSKKTTKRRNSPVRKKK